MLHFGVSRGSPGQILDSVDGGPSGLERFGCILRVFLSIWRDPGQILDSAGVGPDSVERSRMHFGVFYTM